MPVNYMPGDTTALVKAELAATEGSKTKVTVYFNPKEITIDKPIQWQPHKGAEGEHPTLEFTTGTGKSLTVELMFDMFEDKGDVYATYVSQLEQLAFIDSSLKRPPLCTFTWGSNMPVFKGVVADMNVKYTLFLPDGTPCRATVNLKMTESDSLLNKAQAQAASSSGGAPSSSGTTAPAGQRMDTTSNQVGDTSPRDTASRNNVDDPANPPAGNYQGPPRH